MKKTYIIITVFILLILTILFLYTKGEKVYISEERSAAGTLIGTNEYVIRDGNSIMHGKFVNYNQKGVKIAEGQFLDGHINGLCSYYYDNGKIETTQFKKGNITLESTNYNQYGVIDKYIMCDDFGRWTFTINFDEKGVREYDGNPLLEIYQYKIAKAEQSNLKTKQILNIGDTLKYKYLLANIPNTNRTFKIENLGVDDTTAKRIITNTPPTAVDVKEILVKKGVNTIRATVKYEFKDKITPDLNHTIAFYVNVR